MLALALELCPILCYSSTHCSRHGYAPFSSRPESDEAEEDQKWK